MPEQEEWAKVLFGSGEHDDIETLWAVPVGENLYRLENSPWFAYSVSWQDVVEARPQEEGGFPEFVRVVEKSGNRTVRLLLDPPADKSEESQRVLDRLIELACSYEGATHAYIAVNVPPDVDLVTVCDFLTSTGHMWEHADPRYDELYPN